MTDAENTASTLSVNGDGPPRRLAQRVKLVGPGLIAAATGVGAGDVVASLAAGAKLGMALLWAVVLGAIIKFALAEGVGRWHLGSRSTILQGWRSLGRWAMVYFGIYIIVWGFSFGAAAMSATALPLNALFPVLSVRAWGIIAGLFGCVLILVGRYQFFERLMMALVALMFVTVMGCAAIVASESDFSVAMLVPRLPDGSLIYVLGLLGGIGGSITLAAYGYWLREKRWRTPGWIPMMRLDNSMAYLITGVFVVAMMIMGAGLLHGSGDDIGGSQGIVNFAESLRERLGNSVRILFLVGFLAAALTSLLGVWNGVSLLFADFVRVARGIPDGEAADELVNEQSWTFRSYVLWLTFPPMTLLFLDEPVQLVLVYAALGAMFMPFLAVTLLWLLNKRVEAAHRNGWLSNTVMGAALVLFAALAIQKLASLW